MEIELYFDTPVNIDFVQLQELLSMEKRKDLAEVFCVSPKTITNWKKKASLSNNEFIKYPSNSHIYAMTRYFNVSIADLFPKHVSKKSYCDEEYINKQPFDPNPKLNTELFMKFLNRIAYNKAWKDTLNYSNVAIYYWLKEKNIPNINVLYPLCQAIGLPFERLFYEDEHITNQCKKLINNPDLSEIERYLAALWYQRFELLTENLHFLACLRSDVRKEINDIILFGFRKHVEVSEEYIDSLMQL